MKRPSEVTKNVLYLVLCGGYIGEYIVNIGISICALYCMFH